MLFFKRNVQRKTSNSDFFFDENQISIDDWPLLGQSMLIRNRPPKKSKRLEENQKKMQLNLIFL